jgi:hypothetical protein
MNLKNRIKREPAVVVGLLASVVVGLASEYNVVLDETQVELLLAPLVTAVLIRFKVSPANE